ncbi:MAG: PGF-pre-PGF domain-containing protein [Haloarculaceae archaeon]
MNRTVLSLVAISLAGTLLVSTGAVPLFDGQTDRIADDVELAPSDGPNGKYAYLDGDGELVVDISAANPNLDSEGVNPNSITTIDDVFRVRYNGSQYANVWLTHESDAVTFYARGDAIEAQSSSVTLGPNESVAVGLRVDTTGKITDGFVEDITVHASVAEPEDVTGSTGGPDSGETLSVSEVSQNATPRIIVTVTEPHSGERHVVVENLRSSAVVDIDLGRLPIVGNNVTLDGIRFVSTTTGDANFTFTQQSSPPAPIEPIALDGIEPKGYFTLNHSIDGRDVESVSLRFSANSSYLAENGIDPDDVRLLRYGTDGWETLDTTRAVGSPGRLHFVADSPGLSTFAVGVRTPQFVTTQAAVSPTSIQSGETASVTAVLENRGSVPGEKTVTLTRDGVTRQTQTVSLAPGQQTTVQFDERPSTAGAYDYAVDGIPAGTLVVENQSATPDTTQSPTPSDTADSTGQPPDETVPVGNEAAGFDSTALLVIAAILAVIGGTALLRRFSYW